MKRVIVSIIEFIQQRVYSYNDSFVWEKRRAILNSKWLSCTFVGAKNCTFYGKVYLKDPHKIYLGTNNSFGDNLYLIGRKTVAVKQNSETFRQRAALLLGEHSANFVFGTAGK